MARLRKDRTSKASGLRKELEAVERGIRRCIAFITTGDGAPETVREELLALEARKRDLQAALTIEDEPVVELHPNLPKLYERKVTNLVDLLKDDSTRMDAMDAIRGLIERIEVSPGARRGECDVTLVGALAAILTFAQNENAAHQDGVGTCLLVAGARVGLYSPFTSRDIPMLKP